MCLLISVYYNAYKLNTICNNVICIILLYVLIQIYFSFCDNVCNW